MVESYRNERLFNLQCWALTCQTFLDVKIGYGSLKNKYKGDCEFIFFLLNIIKIRCLILKKYLNVSSVYQQI